MSKPDTSTDTEVRSPGLAIGQARALVKFAIQEGLTVQQCLKDTGIPADLFSAEKQKQDYDITLPQEVQMIHNLLQLLSDSAYNLGFAAAQTCKLTVFGLIGQSVLSSANIGEALCIISRYTARASHFVQIRVQQDPQLTRVILDLKIPVDTRTGEFLIAREMGLYIAVYKLMLQGRPLKIREIGLTGSARDVPALKALGCQVHSGTPCNYMQGDTEELSIKMLFGGFGVSTMLEAHCYESMEARTQQTPANDQATLRARIQAELERAENLSMDRGEMAQRLNISERTLSRHLRDEGCSWRELLSEFRIQRARRLLDQTTDSLDEIADNAGYASASALTNAFQRKFGVSPARFRLQKRSD